MAEQQKQEPPATVTLNPATRPSRIARYFKTRWRNVPQLRATLAGSMIFTSAGMNMALGLGWGLNGFYGWTKYFSYAWFVGLIIGTILSAPLRIFVPKKYIMTATGLMILIAGLVFTSKPHNYEVLLVGRYLNGIAIGLSEVLWLMQASEVAVEAYRATCLATEQISFALGMTIQMTYASYWNFSLDLAAHRLHGIFDIVFGISTCVLLIFFIESPIEHIRKSDPEAALICLSRLRRPSGVAAETRVLFEQHKAYVEEQESLNMDESLRQGFIPLVKMIFFRSLMLTFCYSMPLNIALKYSMTLNAGRKWAGAVSGLCRLAGTILTGLLGNKVRHKLPAVISVLIIGSLIIGLGSILQKSKSVSNRSDMYTAMVMYMLVQAFAGFFTPYTSICLVEAFPLRVKPFLMDVCVIVEQIIQIVFIETVTDNIGDILMIQGIITVAVFLFLCLTMPETSSTSLTEAQRRFRKLFYVKFR